MSTLSPQTPHPMKKKIITALVAVALGHTVVLWGLAHMKTPELKPVEKEPLKVRFVKIQEPPKPEPPQPKVEPTPPPPPKEVKIVDTPPPPKKVEKVEQVKKAETPKPVAKPVEVKPQPVAQPAPVVETKVVAKPAPVVVAEPKPVAPPAPPAPPALPAPPPAPPSPKSVSIGGSGVQWSRSPKPQYNNRDLQGETRRIVVLIEADEKGNIKVARVTQSSGIPALDEKIRRAVMSAKFKPYKENGIAYPISASQPFELTLNPNG